MPIYRFEFLDNEQRHQRSVDAECVDDRDALARARALRSVRALRIWAADRLVGSIDPYLSFDLPD